MWVLATDIDNTLTGDAQALEALVQELVALQRSDGLFLILSTGRRLQDILKGFEGEGLPEPDAIVAQIGTEIFLPPFSPQMAPLAAWQAMLQRDFSPRRALAFLEGIEGVDMQVPEYNTTLKVSVHLHRSPDPRAVVEEVRRRIDASDVFEHYRLVWSSTTDLDIIPAKAGKGNAIRYLLDYLELDPKRLVVAGDSGNDLSMFEACPRGIVVANAQPELMRLREEAADTLFFATAECAGGVTEGLRHFGVLTADRD